MNIGIFTDTYRPQINGVVTSIDIFTKALEKKGHNVYIFAPMLPGQKKAEDGIFRFNSAPFPLQKEHRIVFPYSRVLNHFKELNIDVIHSQTPFSMGLLAAFLSRLEKLPLVHTYHTLFIEYIHYLKLPPDYFDNFVKWASRSYCNQCDLVIAPSERIRQELKEYGVTPDIQVIPTGIDLDTVTAPAIPLDLRKKYTIPPERLLLCFIGRLGKEKSIDLLLKAFQRVLQKIPAAHLLIVGDGPEHKALRELTTRLRITDNVTFTGYVERTEVFRHLASADLFVFASRTETQGLVVLEAMASGTPVVAVDAMGVSDVLAGNKGGLLSGFEVDDFSANVARMLEDPELRAQKSDEARSRASEWSAENMTERLLKCYNKAIATYRKGVLLSHEDEA